MTYKYNNNSSLIEYSKSAAILEKDVEFRLLMIGEIIKTRNLFKKS